MHGPSLTVSQPVDVGYFSVRQFLVIINCSQKWRFTFAATKTSCLFEQLTFYNQNSSPCLFQNKTDTYRTALTNYQFLELSDFRMSGNGSITAQADLTPPGLTGSTCGLNQHTMWRQFTQPHGFVTRTLRKM